MFPSSAFASREGVSFIVPDFRPEHTCFLGSEGERGCFSVWGWLGVKGLGGALIGVSGCGALARLLGDGLRDDFCLLDF